MEIGNFGHQFLLRTDKPWVSNNPHKVVYFSFSGKISQNVLTLSTSVFSTITPAVLTVLSPSAANEQICMNSRLLEGIWF